MDIDVGAGVAPELAGYRLEELVGRGGMAVVWRAQHLHLKRRVALKIPASDMLSEPGFRDRFIRESQLAASIQHPNLVTVYDAGEADGLLFIAMQYVEGSDLKRLLDREGRIPVGRACSYLAQIAAALDAAHEFGLVHRDVKPGNVLIEDERCYLSDFGLSKLQQDSMAFTAAGDFVGTLHYSAPEQILGAEIDHRTDVYSLACVAYELLTGTVPFDQDAAAAVMYAHLSAPPPSLSQRSAGIDVAADLVMMRAMAKDPRDRHSSAGAFAADLSTALGVASRSVVRPAPVVDAPRVEAAGGEGRRALPTPTLPGSGTPLFGRDEQLAAMRACWERSATTAGHSMVFLLGDAGAGKTRLAVQFADEVARDGARVLYGRCDEEIGLPYQPFVAALRDLFRQDDAQLEDQNLDSELRELARLVPEAGDRAGARPERDAESTGEDRRYWLFEAVSAVLAHATRDRRLLLVLDDLHWADKPTLLLLRHILSHQDTDRMMIVATHRSAGARDALQRVWAALPSDLDVTRLMISGLDHDAMAQLAADRLKRPVSDRFLSVLAEHTDGNPLFVAEALSALQQLAPGSDEAQLEQALERMGVPVGVAEVILHRLDRLSATTTPVLNAAAVIGREFDLSLLEAVLDKSADELLVSIEEALDAGLVTEIPQEVDRFAFYHALVREAIYTRQSRSRRLRLHSRVGEALEQRAQHQNVASAELAHHFFVARHVTQPARAVRYLRQAAEAAIESLTHEEAETHYANALTALELDPDADEGERCELLLGLGRVQWQASSGDARNTFLAAAAVARRRGDAVHLALAALGVGERYWESERDEVDLVGLLEEALEALPDDALTLRARLLSRLAQHVYFSGDPEGARPLSDEALAIAREVGGDRVLVTALMGHHTVLLHVDHVEERLRLIDEVLELTPREGAIVAEARQWRLYALMESARLPEARLELTRLEALSAKLRLPLFQHVSTSWKAVLVQLAGNIAEAEELAHEAFDLGRRARVSDAGSVLAGMLFTLKREQHRATEVLARIDALPSDHKQLLIWRTALTLARWNAGDEAGARERYERVAAAGLPVPRDVFWLATTALLAEICVALQEAETAPTLYERLLPHADRLVQVSFAACWGSVDRYLALLARTMGDADRAVAHGEAAIECNLAIGAPLLAARARFGCAQALLARGREEDDARAQQFAREALEVATALGSEDLATSCAKAFPSVAP